MRTHRFSGGLEPRWRASRAEPVVQQRRAGGAVVLEARARAARREHQLERQPRGVRRDQHGLLVDRDDPLAPAHLLGDEVAEQALAHRAGRVGAGALALARDRRGHEVERVQLRVRVRQRRARLAPLVDDQLQVRAVGVRAHPLAPDLDRRADLLDGQFRERQHGLRAVDDHLVRAGRGQRREQLGLAAAAVLGAVAAARRRRSSAGLSAGYRFGTTRTLQPGESGGPPSGRSAYSSGGVRSSCPRRTGRARASIGSAGAQRRLAARAPRALAGDDRAVPAERVDAQLGQRSGVQRVAPDVASSLATLG